MDSVFDGGFDRDGGLVNAPAHASVSPKEVDAAVDKAVAYLLSQQKEGNWENMARPKEIKPGYDVSMKWGGETAIATYALLAAGQKITDPPLKKAVEWLEGEDLHGTYAVGLRSQVWNYFPDNSTAKDKKFLAVRDRDKEFELYSRIQKGPHAGFYGYSYGTDMSGSPGSKGIDPKGPPEARGMTAPTASMACSAPGPWSKRGRKSPRNTGSTKTPPGKRPSLCDGGWDYNHGDENSAATYTMTCRRHCHPLYHAGLRHAGQLAPVRYLQGRASPTTNIEKGLAWMDKHISRP